ncbi:MAG: ABC transporter ATP-binding protein [Actinoplanes sp.]
MRLLEVNDLNVTFPTSDGVVNAVRGVSFGIDPGRTLGIVGESGSGKSVAAMTLLGLSRGATVTGQALFDGDDLLSMSEPDLRAVRGARIAMVFQDPLSSLHPLYPIGWQITEAIQAHTRTSRRAAREIAVDLLAMVGIPQPRRRIGDYPHQFSGGMRQRVMIAIALALKPDIVIADEPTTALDTTVQAQILDLLQRLRNDLGMALVIITHDLGIIAQTADEVLVMYAGRVAETAERRDLFYRSHHPYTLGLLASVPAAAGTGRLQPIPGQPPSPIRLPAGCPFAPRCAYRMGRCAGQEPPLIPVTGHAGHQSACWLPSDAVGTGTAARTARDLAVRCSGPVAA